MVDNSFFEEQKEQSLVKSTIVGKYFDIGDFTLEDSYISVIEAVKHASAANNCRAEIVWIDSKRFEKEPSTLAGLKQFDGIIVPGGFGSSGVEGKISAIRFCRENNLPFLGLCYGLQLAVIEFARNVCAMQGANTTEIDPKTRFPVIDILPEQKALLEKKDYGATMRLGAYPAKLKKGSAVWELYSKKENVEERHRHRFEFCEAGHRRRRRRHQREFPPHIATPRQLRYHLLHKTPHRGHPTRCHPAR